MRYWQDLADVRDLEELLIWDQSTQLPAAAATDRGRQLSHLALLRQAKLTDSEYSRLLHDERCHRHRPPEQQRALDLARREQERAARLPSALVRRTAQLNAEGYGAWAQAKPCNDFRRMVPVLDHLLDLRLETAAHFPEFERPLDFFIDQVDEGCTSYQLDTLFGSLQPALRHLLRMRDPAAAPPADPLAQPFDPPAQWRFAERVMADLGFAFDRGTRAQAPHPFMARVGHRDVRIAVRFDPKHLAPGLFSVLHETGHALYEQGIGEDLLGTPLGIGVSAGVHESQARLWENLVGRSLPFWEAYLPELRATFVAQLDYVNATQFYQAVNRVSPGPVRVQADELTYNLHVIIRFGLERDLLDGHLKVTDLPEAWNAAYEENLGLTPPSDTQGVLQDVHWYAGQLGGAFHSYTLGNLMAAQMFDAAQLALPDLEEAIRERSFTALRQWLTRHVYQGGRLSAPADLIRQVTGGPLDSAAFTAHLTRKFTALSAC